MGKLCYCGYTKGELRGALRDIKEKEYIEEALEEDCVGCSDCRWYDFDLPDYESGQPFYNVCNATNKGNLKGFPFKNKLNCFETKLEKEI